MMYDIEGKVLFLESTLPFCMDLIKPRTICSRLKASLINHTCVDLP